MKGKCLSFLTMMMLSSLFLMSCNNTLSVDFSDEESITLLDIKGKSLASTSDNKIIQKVASILNERVPAKEKILPIFKYEIIYQEQRWLLTTKGYIRDNTQESGKLYKLKQTGLIVELLSQDDNR